MAAPPFLRDFITRVWSQVLLRAAGQGGADGPLAQRLRRVGRELFLSVQPKPTPAHRKAFLAELPKLMLELTEGMNLIGWPEAQRRDFFGQLMPAHAESLRGTAVRQLDINMMARQVEGALERPLPSPADVKAAALTLPVLTEEVVLPSFSADEASRVGLVSESAVDWDGTVDIVIGDDDASRGRRRHADRCRACRRRPARPSRSAAARWPTTCRSASPTRCTWVASGRRCGCRMSAPVAASSSSRTARGTSRRCR